MEALVVPKIHLKKVQSANFMYVKGRGNERGYKTEAASRIPLMISMSICKTKQKLLV